VSSPEQSRYGGAWAAQAGQPTATMPTVGAGAPAQPQAGSLGQGAPSRPGTTAATPGRAQRRGPRRARLVLARIDPWSVMKLAFLLSIAIAVVMVVAVFMLWSVLDGLGVFDSLAKTLEDVTRNENGSGGVDLTSYVGLSRVMGITMILSLVNIVLMTALATLGAFLYNLAASIVGGLHVTFAEDA
jgi:hypothetical protein